ncbi:MAG: o-succinylbenzoate synthase [Cytophagales bacterium]|nr:MAG: o-succinylbenzoate synthase [Cytophagales bacterium]
MNWQIERHRLVFHKEAGTSRGVLRDKDHYLLLLAHPSGRKAIGEAAPLPLLSIDDVPSFEDIFTHFLTTAQLQQYEPQSEEELLSFVQKAIPAEYPTMRFALEMALIDYYKGAQRCWFDSPFVSGLQAIRINGLVWMGSPAYMQQQIEEKLSLGFSCLKMKIGAIDFEEEYKLLQNIRKQYDASKIVLRVDANGAFLPEKATYYLEKLALLEIHSIEQPIAVRKHEAMKALCQANILPIALDEELIGVYESEAQNELLNHLKPQYIILKPTLLGGFAATRQWIQIAESLSIGWWVTSALESNIGLEAIAQFTATFPYNTIPQGLGTGLLYKNNFESALQLKGENLWRIATS